MIGIMKRIKEIYCITSVGSIYKGGFPFRFYTIIFLSLKLYIFFLEVLLFAIAMDEEIIRDLLKCSLTEAETNPILLEEADLAEGILECQASILVKVLSYKETFISTQGFALAMAKAWNVQGQRVGRLSGNILHVFFPSIVEKRRISENGPWCFDNQLLLIKDWSRGITPLNQDFDECKFNIQIRGLQTEFLTKDVAIKLGNAFVNVEFIELRQDKGGKKFFRLRVPVRVGRHLRRMIQFKVENSMVAGYLAYERLPMLCFHCGLMGHLIRQCPKIPVGEDPRRMVVYGLWIKAPLEKSWLIFHMAPGEDNRYGLTEEEGDTDPEIESIMAKMIRLVDSRKTYGPPGFGDSQGITATLDGFDEAINESNDGHMEDITDIVGDKDLNALSVMDNHVEVNAAFTSPGIKEKDDIAVSGLGNNLNFTDTLKFFDYQLVKESKKSPYMKKSNSKKRTHPYQKNGESSKQPASYKKLLLSTVGSDNTSAGLVRGGAAATNVAIFTSSKQTVSDKYVSAFMGANMLRYHPINRKFVKLSRRVRAATPAPTEPVEEVKEYVLPSWARFDLGLAPVYWKTMNGLPPTAGEKLKLFYNPAAAKLVPNQEFGIAFNGGFNQPIMCGGEPRAMLQIVRGKADPPIYTIQICVPKYAMSLIFSFTNGAEWDGPYKLQFQIPKAWRNKPVEFFSKGLAEELSKDGACDRAIFPDTSVVSDRCAMIGNLTVEGGDRCDLDLVPGCTDPNEPMFNPLANVDDGSCPPFSDSEE